MCILCIEIQKQNMTLREVARAYRETEVPDEHLGELLVEIEKNYGLEEVGAELNDLYEKEFEREYGPPLNKHK